MPEIEIYKAAYRDILHSICKDVDDNNIYWEHYSLTIERVKLLAELITRIEAMEERMSKGVEI